MRPIISAQVLNYLPVGMYFYQKTLFFLSCSLGLKTAYLLLCLLGTSYSKAEDGKSFTNALYGNGPGYQIANNTRPDMNSTVSSKFYEFNCFTLKCRTEFLSARYKLCFENTDAPSCGHLCYCKHSNTKLHFIKK